MKKIIIFAIIFINTILALPQIGFAQIQPIPCPSGELCSVGNSTNGVIAVNSLIQTIVNWLVSIAFGVAVLFLVIGGFLYIFSAGNEERAEKARATVLNAIIGLVIIILSYVIINVITNTISGFANSPA